MKFLPFVPLAALIMQAETTYQKPSPEILQILNAPPTPMVSVSPVRTHVLIVQGRRNPPVADLARPMLRLAGLRIDPQTNGPARGAYAVSLSLKRLDTLQEIPVELPPQAKISGVKWSPDGQHFAFLNTTETAVQLWVADTATGKPRLLSGFTVNAVGEDAYQWLPDNHSLLIETVPAVRPALPADAAAPSGPNVQQSAGRPAPIRTYQDLLATPRDEALFEHYATAQLVQYDVTNNQKKLMGQPAIFDRLEIAPDGKHILISRIHRPFSYLHPAPYFPHTLEVWDSAAQVVKQIADQPLADRIPIDGVRTGPREISWRPNAPATLVWAEALDGGNPKEKVPFRDHLLAWSAPFNGEPAEWGKTQERLVDVQWLKDGTAAVVYDYDRDSKHLRTFLANPDKANEPMRLVNDRNRQDRYRDPGAPLLQRSPFGQPVIIQNNGSIYLASLGATPQGERPFLDKLNLQTLQTERLFRSGEQEYERPVTLLDDAGTRVLTLHESPSSPPNYFVVDVKNNTRRALTNLTDPAPQLRSIKKQLVTYKRPDGVQLSFTLYLPPGYQQGTRLPTIVWAYPLEYNDPETAGQVGGSTQRFTTLSGYTHLFFLMAGYAVLDNATMPVVGNPETVNDTYIDQIVADAKAAIDKAVELGVTDPNRVGIGGHSYGAFMTANLLAHSQLFRAGIARSGAYNRTLTPFGFQSERRTLWEAESTYLKMSPFLQAHQIKAPLLLIHGEADNNPGTFPIQSERMYQAVRGNGGTVRLVMLPHESHGYLARESIEHTLWEMISWFDQYVKNAPSTPVSGQE